MSAIPGLPSGNFQLALEVRGAWLTGNELRYAPVSLVGRVDFEPL